MILDLAAIVNRLELTMVLERQAKPEAGRQAEALLHAAAVVEEPVMLQQGMLAHQAYYDFGKGRHKAGSNFGDCFAYALATALGEALLFKRNDFNRTDVQVAAGARRK